MALAQVVSVGKLETDKEIIDYVVEELVQTKGDKTKIDEITKESIVATIFDLINSKQLPEVKNSFEIDGRTFYCPDLLLDIKVKHFIEIVNLDLNEDNYENCHMLTACLYREDWNKAWSNSEYIANATLFYESSCKYAIWALQKYSELISLLRRTFPILYENKHEDKENEGRRAYALLNGLATDDPTKWETAGDLKLETAFAWMEQKEIERDRQKAYGNR